jgi:hypothetical protein
VIGPVLPLLDVQYRRATARTYETHWDTLAARPLGATAAHAGVYPRIGSSRTPTDVAVATCARARARALFKMQNKQLR